MEVDVMPSSQGITGSIGLGGDSGTLFLENIEMNLCQWMEMSGLDVYTCSNSMDRVILIPYFPFGREHVEHTYRQELFTLSDYIVSDKSESYIKLSPRLELTREEIVKWFRKRALDMLPKASIDDQCAVKTYDQGSAAKVQVWIDVIGKKGKTWR